MCSSNLEEAVRLGGESVIPDPYYVSTVALMYPIVDVWSHRSISIPNGNVYGDAR